MTSEINSRLDVVAISASNDDRRAFIDRAIFNLAQRAVRPLLRQHDLAGQRFRESGDG